jgi:hypothetical protein
MLYSETLPYVGLSGSLPLTGVGWVAAFATGGSGGIFSVGSGENFNFDIIAITGTGLGGVNSAPAPGGRTSLSWVGNPAVNLQSTTNLAALVWVDVNTTLGLYSLTVSNTGPQQYFRLIQH